MEMLLEKKNERLVVLEENYKTLLEKKNERLVVLEENYKTLKSNSEKYVDTLEKRFSQYHRRCIKQYVRSIAKYDTRLQEFEKQFDVKSSHPFSRIEEVEETCLHAVHENEELLLIEMRSVKEILTESLKCNFNSRESTPGDNILPVSVPPSNKYNNTLQRLEGKEKQLENTISQSPFINKDKNDITVNENVTDIKIEEVEETEVLVENIVTDPDISPDQSQQSFKLSSDSFTESGRTSFDNTVELLSQHSDVNTDADEDEVIDASDAYESDMCVEISTIESVNSDSDLSDEGEIEENYLVLLSRLEILNSEWCVYRWYVETFHEIQFSGFDIFSPQFTVDNQTYCELKISWFNDMKDGVCIELLDNKEGTDEMRSAMLTCEGNGCFNSMVIVANNRPNVPFLSIDRIDVDVSEQCNSKTLRDFIENDTLFVNCYFRRR